MAACTTSSSMRPARVEASNFSRHGCASMMLAKQQRTNGAAKSAPKAHQRRSKSVAKPPRRRRNGVAKALPPTHRRCNESAARASEKRHTKSVAKTPQSVATSLPKTPQRRSKSVAKTPRRRCQSVAKSGKISPSLGRGTSPDSPFVVANLALPKTPQRCAKLRCPNDAPG
jgi:hypothetical protein